MPVKNKKEVFDFIAKYFGDISKAIVTVGIASYFFKELPLRITCGGITAIVFFMIAVIIINKQGGK